MADERAADQTAGVSRGNELSGVVAGSSVQAGAISGGVHFHQTQAQGQVAAPFPRQLLAPTPHFTNRAVELTALDRLLGQARPGVVVLSGAGP